MRVLKPGLRLKSAVCATEMMVIRAAAGEVDVRCGGAPMLAASEAAPAAAVLDPAFAHPSLIGKRYVDAGERFELLCTRGGEGAVSIDGQLLAVKQAKALPSSD